MADANVLIPALSEILLLISAWLKVLSFVFSSLQGSREVGINLDQIKSFHLTQKITAEPFINEPGSKS